MLHVLICACWTSLHPWTKTLLVIVKNLWEGMGLKCNPGIPRFCRCSQKTVSTGELSLPSSDHWLLCSLPWLWATQYILPRTHLTSPCWISMTSFSGFFPLSLMTQSSGLCPERCRPAYYKSVLPYVTQQQLSSSRPPAPFVPSRVPSMSQPNNEGVMHLEKEV